MKIAVFFLSCFIALSRQQNSVWEMVGSHRGQYHPHRELTIPNTRRWEDNYSWPYSYSYYADQYPYSHRSSFYYPPQLSWPSKYLKDSSNIIFLKAYRPAIAPMPKNEQKFNGLDDSPNADDQMAEARVGSSIGKGFNQPESRLGGFLFPALLFGGGRFLATSTRYSFTTTTITSTTVISCIVSGSFAAGSTNACRRKRQVTPAVLKHFMPSQVQKVEPSAVLSLGAFEYPESMKRDRIPFDVLSSFDDQQVDEWENPINDYLLYNRDDRAFNAYNRYLSVTTTSIVTKATITVTSSKKTVNIGSNLICLPSAYSIC